MDTEDNAEEPCDENTSHVQAIFQQINKGGKENLATYFQQQMGKKTKATPTSPLPRKGVSCNTCGQRYASKKTLELHHCTSSSSTVSVLEASSTNIAHTPKKKKTPSSTPTTPPSALVSMSSPLHTPKKLKCDHCHQQYARKDSLKRHIANVHGADSMLAISPSALVSASSPLHPPNKLNIAHTPKKKMAPPSAPMTPSSASVSVSSPPQGHLQSR